MSTSQVMISYHFDRVRSEAADRLMAEAAHDEAIALFYCEYSQMTEAQTAVAIVSSFISQLLLQLDSIPQETIEAYQDHHRRSTRPDLQESIKLFQGIQKKFSRTWLLVDAPDELDHDSRDELMEVIETLNHSTRFFITSRPQSIDSRTLEESTLRLTLSAHKKDLTALIRSTMGKAVTASRRVRESPGWASFVDDTVKKLIELADGMFILVSLQLEMLLRPRTLAEMRKLLENVSNKLDDFYAVTLERIKARESDMALKILSWLVKHLRPMSVYKLREALAIDYSTGHINTDAFIQEDDMLEMSCGLIIIDKQEIVSLAHATVHEFLSSRLDDINHFDLTIAKTCLHYLNFDNFNRQAKFSRYGHDDHDIEYDHRVEDHPFLPYAAQYWIDHYNRSPNLEELTRLAWTLINGPNATAMLQAYSKKTFIDMTRFTPLHVASFLKILPLVERLIAEAIQEARTSDQLVFHSQLVRCIDSTGAFGNTPLLHAVHNRHSAIAKALLQTNVVDPSIMDNTIIRMTFGMGE